jgi:hypothetical protein
MAQPQTNNGFQSFDPESISPENIQKKLHITDSQIVRAKQGLLDIGEKDKRVWALITSVPFLSVV